MNDDNTVIIMCPPYPEYTEAPTDQPGCELFECPKCEGQMWLSQKKKGAIMFSSCIGKEVVLACYDCITKMVNEDTGFSLNHFTKEELIAIKNGLEYLPDRLHLSDQYKEICQRIITKTDLMIDKYCDDEEEEVNL